MNMNPKVESAVRVAAGLERKEKYQEAAKAYRKAIAAAGTDDPLLAGMLHINLGNQSAPPAFRTRQSLPFNRRRSCWTARRERRSCNGATPS